MEEVRATEVRKRDQKANGTAHKSVESVPSVKIRDSDKWEVRKLGEVCTFINGRAYSKKELLVSGKYPVLRVGNFFTNKSWYYSDLELERDKYCDRGDLLYAWSASFGPQIWDGGKAIYHYHIWKVVPNPNLITKEFLYRLLEWDTEQIKSTFGTGTTMIHVGKGLMEKRSVRIPNVLEQQRIVSILDEAFAAIDQAKANVERNLQNAKELFESELNAIFSSRGEDWEEKRLGDIASFRNGINYTKQSNGESIKVVGVKDFQQHFWVPSEDLENVTIDGQLAEIDLLKENDILTVRSNGNPELIGRCILAGVITEKVTHSGFTIRIRLTSDSYFAPYLCYYLKSAKAKTQLVEGGTGINIKSLNQVLLTSMTIPFCKVAEQQTIVNRLDTLSAETKKLESKYQQKLAALEVLKKSILQKAFSGELSEKEVVV